MFLIINPKAGKRKGAKILPRLKKYFEANEVPFYGQLISIPGQAQLLAKKAVSEGHKKVVVVGGDGTVNQVAQSLVNTEVSLGIIPTRIANDFAKALGIPLNLKKAVKKVCFNKAQKIDVGKIDSEEMGPRYFLNIFGLGFDALIAEKIQNRRKLKLGNSLSYVCQVIKEKFTFQKTDLRLDTPERGYEGPTLAVMVANGQTEGKYFKVAPQAQLADGLLEVCVVGNIPNWLRPFYILMAFWGKHLNLAKVDYQKAEKLKIVVPAGWICHIDGEPIELNPVKDSENEKNTQNKSANGVNKKETIVEIQLLARALKVIPGSPLIILQEKQRKK